MAADLQNIVYAEIQSAAQPLATALNMPNMIPVDEALLGDFPWYWQVGTNFNSKTFGWIDSIFAFNGDGYVGSNGESLATGLYNVYAATRYVLDATDAAALNAAVLANAAVVNTVITDWSTTQGAIPATYATQAAQINYVTSQVLLWGTPGLTLGTLRNSTNPMALLPNVPIGGNQVVNDLMTYLGNTSSVANIQAAVVGYNNEMAVVMQNIDPQPPLTTATAGYMTTVNDAGATQVEIAITIAESTAVIQNNLLPASGTGKSFSASFTAVQQASQTVQISADGGAAGVGDLDFFLTFLGEGSTSYNMFSADGSQSECSVKLTYNGVTTVTPQYTAYVVGTGVGWWNPDPISQAAASDGSQSSYEFSPKPAYNFAADGNFGAIARLMISQQPVITLTYTTSNYQAYQQTFQEKSSFAVTFLGIPIAGGSQSYYQCTTSYESSTETVTVTMMPVGNMSPPSATDQLANVVGAQIIWPGAPTTN